SDLLSFPTRRSSDLHSRIVRGSQTIGPGTPLPSTAATPRDGSETAEWGRWMKSLTPGGLAPLPFQNGRGAGSVGGTVSARSAGTHVPLGRSAGSGERTAPPSANESENRVPCPVALRARSPPAPPRRAPMGAS